MESALSIPAAEKFFDGFQSADVKITDWDYPKATIQAVIQTYRSDFFQDFTLSDAFKVKSMHNLFVSNPKPNIWELEIVFTKKFATEVFPLMEDQYIGDSYA